jgi:hypothetical protein
MKFPSIEQLVRAGRNSAGRFPLALLSAAIAATAGTLLPDSSIDDDILTGFLYVATLGIPLFLAIDLAAERRRTSSLGLWIARLVAVGLLVALYIGRLSWSQPVELLRYVQLSVAAHLLVSVAPYLSVRERNGFWQYNRSLLLRFLVAAVFSVVLYVGLVIALLAVDNLLGVDVDGDSYLRLWFVIAFLFNTWFFIAGLPDDLEGLDRQTDYPPLLKVLGQYILSPLVTVYLLILTAYLGRILITRVWPSGWIGYLVSSVAAAGILSPLVLLRPDSGQRDAPVGDLETHPAVRDHRAALLPRHPVVVARGHLAVLRPHAEPQHQGDSGHSGGPGHCDVRRSVECLRGIPAQPDRETGGPSRAQRNAGGRSRATCRGGCRSV